MSSYGRFFLSGKTLHAWLRSPENLPDQVGLIIWDIVMIHSAISLKNVLLLSECSLINVLVLG